MEIIVIASGKGGVGKTSMAVNLSIAMVRNSGLRVALVDADIGTANVNLLLGVSTKWTIRDLQAGMAPMEVGREIYGVNLYAGESGAEPDGGYDIVKIVEMVRDIDPDVIVLDTHPGVSVSTLTAISTGDHVIIISSPEITAVTDTYQLIKKIGNKRQRISILMNESNEKLGYAKANLIINVAKTHLQRNIHYLGNIRYSGLVREAVAEQIPFYVLYPVSGVGEDLLRICGKILEEKREG